MKAVWSRFWGFPVNAGRDVRGLQKYNIPGDLVKLSGTWRKFLTGALPLRISATMKTPTTIICICAIIIG